MSALAPVHGLGVSDAAQDVESNENMNGSKTCGLIRRGDFRLECWSASKPQTGHILVSSAADITQIQIARGGQRNPSTRSNLHHYGAFSHGVGHIGLCTDILAENPRALACGWDQCRIPIPQASQRSTGLGLQTRNSITPHLTFI